MSGLKLHPNAAASLNQWHAMIREGDLQALPALLDPNAVCRSPRAHAPDPGRGRAPCPARPRSSSRTTLHESGPRALPSCASR